MNKILRILVSLMLVPAFVLMTSAACCCPTAQASNSVINKTSPAFKAVPRHCCPEDSHCVKSNLVNKDEAVQNQDIQLNSAAKVLAAQSVAEYQASPYQYQFFTAVAFFKTDPVQLSTVQLLI